MVDILVSADFENIPASRREVIKISQVIRVTYLHYFLSQRYVAFV